MGEEGLGHGAGLQRQLLPGHGTGIGKGLLQKQSPSWEQ